MQPKTISTVVVVLWLMPWAFSSAQTAQPMTNADVVKMVQAGLAPDTVVLAIAKGQVAFDVSPTALSALSQQGVPDSIVGAMLETVAGRPPAVAPATDPASGSRLVTPTPRAPDPRAGSRGAAEGGTGAATEPGTNTGSPRVLTESAFRTPPGGDGVGTETSTESAPSGEPRALTAAAVRHAIENARSHPGASHGLALADNAKQIFKAVGELGAARGQLAPGTQVSASGFQIRVYTPLDWIAQQAGDSARRHLVFTERDVTEDMRRMVVRVVALPSTRPHAGLNLGLDVSSVADIVIKNASRTEELHGLRRTAFQYEDLKGLLVEFSLEEFTKTRGSGNAEFHVVVVGTNGLHKDFTIRKRHFASLTLP